MSVLPSLFYPIVRSQMSFRPSTNSLSPRLRWQQRVKGLLCIGAGFLLDPLSSVQVAAYPSAVQDGCSLKDAADTSSVFRAIVEYASHSGNGFGRRGLEKSLGIKMSESHPRERTTERIPGGHADGTSFFADHTTGWDLPITLTIGQAGSPIDPQFRLKKRTTLHVNFSSRGASVRGTWRCIRGAEADRYLLNRGWDRELPADFISTPAITGLVPDKILEPPSYYTRDDLLIAVDKSSLGFQDGCVLNLTVITDVSKHKGVR